MAKLSRSQLREVAVKTIYNMTLLNESYEEAISHHLEINNDYVSELVNKSFENIEVIRNNIDKLLIDWTFERLGYMDRAILQTITYEIIYTETPGIVCINEGVELAKKYCDDDVIGIINAVLDKIYNAQ